MYVNCVPAWEGEPEVFDNSVNDYCIILLAHNSTLLDI